MSNSIEQKILNRLLDKYETSASFIGKNKYQQSFKESVIKLFPQYEDHSDFIILERVNEAIDILVRLGYVKATKTNGILYKIVELNINQIEQIYKYINRTNKRKVHEDITNLLYRYKDKNHLMQQYCEEQLKAISK